MKVVVVQADMITPYGDGINACREGLLAGRSAVAPVTRFNTGSFGSDLAAEVPGLVYHGSRSLVMQMLERLFAGFRVPADAKLLLATTKGEIDFLEKSLIEGGGDPAESRLDRLLGKVVALTGAAGGAMVVSAACTSSAAAVGRAAALIRRGEADCILVAACDSVTEFIYSGFSALMALDKVPARPFDRNRAGLSLGEAAACMLLMSETRARREGRQILGEISGWGMSDDANHMTGPSRESEGLIRAIRQAIQVAGIDAGEIGFISAHGTGTSFNDEMEMRAFNTLFADRKRPVYSVKGGIGHTMGAAGLVELIIALEGVREKVVPPTVNLQAPDDDALGWVSDRAQAIPHGMAALVSNAGFSGVNTALVVTGGPS